MKDAGPAGRSLLLAWVMTSAGNAGCGPAPVVGLELRRHALMAAADARPASTAQQPERPPRFSVRFSRLPVQPAVQLLDAPWKRDGTRRTHLEGSRAPQTHGRCLVEGVSRRSS